MYFFLHYFNWLLYVCFFYAEPKKIIHKDRPYQCISYYIILTGCYMSVFFYAEPKKIIPKDRPYQCFLCTKSFKTADKLVKHRRKHKFSVKHPCTVCGVICHSNRDLKIHMKTHTYQELHPCTLCQDKFDSLAALEKHKRLNHIGMFPHQCKFCKGRFATPQELNVHDLQHICDICGKTFENIAYVSIHKKIVHPSVLCIQDYLKPYAGKSDMGPCAMAQSNL